MDVKLPAKREKLSERFTLLVTPTLKAMLNEADKITDVPQFTRELLQSALEELKRQQKI